MAIIIGFVVIRPNLEAISGIGINNFKGIYPILTDDEEYYFARVHEALEGHRGWAMFSIKEHKDKPFMAPPLAENFLPASPKYFNISVPALFMLSDFVLPFLGVILLYALFYSMTASKKLPLGRPFFSTLFLSERLDVRLTSNLLSSFCLSAFGLFGKFIFPILIEKCSNIIFGLALYSASCFIFTLIFGRR